MSPAVLEFLKQVEKNLHFELYFSHNTLMTFPQDTGWRMAPFLISCQLNYAALVQIKDSEEVKVGKGEAISIPPGVTHRIAMDGPGEGYSSWSHSQCEVLPGVSLFTLIPPPLLIRGKQAERIGEINRSLARQLEMDHSLFSLKGLLNKQKLGWDLICTMLESVSFRETRIDLMDQVFRLNPVLAYIEEHLDKPITHETMARSVGLSASHFHALFRSAFGCAPYEYVQRMRIKKAQQLLLQSSFSIAEVGEQVGHPDPYHFSRTFRRQVGVSPVKYRKEGKGRSF